MMCFPQHRISTHYLSQKDTEKGISLSLDVVQVQICDIYIFLNRICYFLMLWISAYLQFILIPTVTTLVETPMALSAAHSI